MGIRQSYQIQNEDFQEIFQAFNQQFILACLILGLEYIHSNNIVIVGLKAENILFDEYGYCCISGFEHAFIEDDSDDEFEEQNSKQQEFISKSLITQYLAPEVLLRQQPSFEADYYSLGIILYEITTGNKAIQGNYTHEDVIRTILRDKIQVKQEDLPEDWDPFGADFMNKLIQKKPQNRMGYYGIEDIKKHSWLKNMPWQKIQKKKNC
ncbi:protein kinase domain protein [Ichthyophthirius multifiliis]|uniref:Protein kinase domain protein n=1 Tax=Ichthyophthirius multifiliis TaxID=5932 RepID=G0R0G3_ICHMU|nr:protein kinase domain protein [Ichthyophthirius multifiliis]EGR29042.1 protein kinase domain protein [Ichthyophthirius multifiliis]|eukprot:XP_004030278.1 protein kinase domain protein [Ichthyophthirius multifiliis]